MFSLLLLVVIVFSDEEDGGSGGNLIYGGVSVSQEVLEMCIRDRVVSLVAVGLVFNADGVKDILLELFNKIIGA